MGKGKQHNKFKAARYPITSNNEGGRSSTRPFFEDRGVDPDENRFIQQKAMERIDNPDDITIAWNLILTLLRDLLRGRGEGEAECMNS